MTTLLDHALGPERFRALGHELIDLLADHLADAHARKGPVLPVRAPEDEAADWPVPALDARVDLRALIARVIASSNHLHHPRYVGHQVSAPLPVAALAELASAVLNNGMAVFEMGPAATAMERACLQWMARKLGLGDGAGGVLTSGGSVGNLTALLAARQGHAGSDPWTDGVHAGPPLSILVGGDAHYSIARAAQIMGLGAAAVVPVALDARHRLDPAALPASLERARRGGRRPIAVVASTCSTATGAFDPLSPIADFCEAEALWLHVDAAHGGAAALSPHHAHLLAGIERADSIVWDAHKMLAQPALVTAVLFREARRSFETFAQRASYLFGEANEWDIGQRTLECTKRMMSLELYATLACDGERVLAAHVERTFELGARLAALVSEAPDFELALAPDCNIVCFRHTPAGVPDADLDALQSHARAEILRSGAFYLVETWLDGKRYLRTTIMNPLTDEADLRALLDAIRLQASGFRLQPEP